MFRISNDSTAQTSQGRQAPEHSVTVSVRPLYTNVYGKLVKSVETQNKSYTFNVHDIGNFEDFCGYLQTACVNRKNASKNRKMMWHFEQAYDAKDPADQLFRAQKALEEYRIPDYDKKIMLLLRLPRDVRSEYIELIIDSGSFSEFGQKLINAVSTPAGIVEKVSDKGKEPATYEFDISDDNIDDMLNMLKIEDEDIFSDLILRTIPKSTNVAKYNKPGFARVRTCIYCQSKDHFVKRECQQLTHDIRAGLVKIIKGIVCYPDGTQVPVNARGGGMVAIVHGGVAGSSSSSNNNSSRV
ncbi:hypothetical protein LPJ73_005124 [Coemansia sp. RSA 2703]|nr:hypothetical protein LPJ73_005124 [Coemansia sp. RSA 2703]KAJ2366081.1 hypothetical protein IW150_006037 [Coemansia sp. RSA 2607]